MTSEKTENIIAIAVALFVVGYIAVIYLNKRGSTASWVQPGPCKAVTAIEHADEYMNLHWTSQRHCH